MKESILALLLIISFCGCSVPQAQEAVAVITPEPEQDIKAEMSETISPFEKEERETLPLPDDDGTFSDMDELIDSIITNYEVVHITDFEQEITFYDSTVKKVDDGYCFSGPPPDYKPSKCLFQKGALENYFDTPDNYYAVLARFKLYKSHDVVFNFSTRFGFMSYGLCDNIYPAVDFCGERPGSIIDKNWNNFIYEPGEWAYVFLSVTKYGQGLCYSWAEDDVNDYTYFTAYSDVRGMDENGIYDLGWWGDDWYRYSAGAWEGKVIISDFWIYTYEELKR